MSTPYVRTETGMVDVSPSALIGSTLQDSSPIDFTESERARATEQIRTGQTSPGVNEPFHETDRDINRVLAGEPTMFTNLQGDEFHVEEGPSITGYYTPDESHIPDIERPGDKIGKALIAVGLIIGFFLFLKEFASGLGQGVTS